MEFRRSRLRLSAPIISRIVTRMAEVSRVVRISASVQPETFLNQVGGKQEAINRISSKAVNHVGQKKRSLIINNKYTDSMVINKRFLSLLMS